MSLDQTVDTQKVYFKSDKVKMEYITGDGFPGQKGNHFSKDGALTVTREYLIYTPLTSTYFSNVVVPLDQIIQSNVVTEGFFSSSHALQLTIRHQNENEKTIIVRMTMGFDNPHPCLGIIKQLQSRDDAPLNEEDVDPVPTYEP